MENTNKKKFASVVSVTSNTLVIAAKLVVGVLSGSISIISEAVHSFADLLAAIITFFAVSRSSQPADKDHPFGHGKYEDVSGFIEGSLIILAGVFIILEASKKLIAGTEINTEPVLGIYVMAFSAFVNFVVSSYLLKVAKECDSISLYADGQHLSGVDFNKNHRAWHFRYDYRIDCSFNYIKNGVFYYKRNFE